MSFLSHESRKLDREDMRRMNVGERFWGVTLEQVPEGCAYRDRISAYLDAMHECIKKGIGLLFYGDYRSGKTAAAIIVMKNVVAFGGTALFIRADELSKAVIEKTIFDDDETLEERMKSVDLLVIDDLGQEHSKDFGASVVESIIRNRYNHRKAILVTLNIEIAEIEKKYGLGVLRVMRSMTAPVAVAGTNWMEKEREEVRKTLGE